MGSVSLHCCFMYVCMYCMYQYHYKHKLQRGRVDRHGLWLKCDSAVSPAMLVYSTTYRLLLCPVTTHKCNKTMCCLYVCAHICVFCHGLVHCPVTLCGLSSTNYMICNSLSFTEIIPVVFTEGDEEERLDNLFEVGEGVAPIAVLNDAESVVLSLARKCLRYHTNVEWGMLVALSYSSVQCCSTHSRMGIATLQPGVRLWGCVAIIIG